MPSADLDCGSRIGCEVVDDTPVRLFHEVVSLTDWTCGEGPEAAADKMLNQKIDH